MRLGTTSFIHPGGWLENVQRLADRFDDIELLFFEAHALPAAAEIAALAACKAERGLTYSLHTPLDPSLASEDPERRRRGLSEVLAALAAGAPLEPENVVVHVYHGEHEHALERPTDLAAWRRRARGSLEALLGGGLAPERLCVELLDYDFELIEPVVAELGVSFAVDVGHLVRDGRDELAILRQLLPRTRLVQWHGTDPTGRDHRSLELYPPERARALLALLAERRYEGVLTIEVFREADLDGSCALLEPLLAEHGLTPRRWRRRGP